MADRYADDERRAPLDLTSLTDEQLARLAEYRGMVAASTPDERAAEDLRAVWAERKRRDSQ